VTAKVRKLEKFRDEGRVPKAGQRWRVAAWLTFWVDNIAVPPNVSENTHSGYSVDVRVHLIPGIGAHWLDKLEPEHVEKLYAKMQRNGRPREPRTTFTARSATRSTKPCAAGTLRGTRYCWQKRLS
jgi:hypothetical protein